VISKTGAGRRKRTYVLLERLNAFFLLPLEKGGWEGFRCAGGLSEKVIITDKRDNKHDNNGR
jgi:hypothetical protein